MRLLTAVVLVCFTAASAAAESNTAPNPPTTQAAFAEAAAAVDAFHLALAAGDTAGALAALEDEVQIYEQGWVERSKAEYAAHHLPSDIAFSSAVAHQQTARAGSASGDVAYVTTEGRTTGKFEGKPVDSISLETMMLKRSVGGWKIAHIHWSSRAAKK